MTYLNDDSKEDMIPFGFFSPPGLQGQVKSAFMVEVKTWKQTLFLANLGRFA